MKTQPGGNSKRLIYETMGKRKRLNSFRLVVLLKESGSEFQYLGAAYLTELRPYVVVLFFCKTNTFRKINVQF